MPKERVPAFQFYPKDFLTDSKVVQMSNTEVGIYMRLLCYCWLDGDLPLETEALASMARMPLKQFTKLWENSIVKTCFHLGEDGRLHQKRLDAERDKQTEFKRRQSDRGKAGADARWSDGASMAQASSKHSQDGHPEALLSDGSSSPISDLQSPISRPQKPEIVTGRSKRPIFSGQRLTVFEWQFDELAKTLGPHLDGFGLDAWFYQADAEAVKSGLVRPSREWWPWLEQATLAEAQRRGLPIGGVVDPEDAMWEAIARKGPSVRP